MTADRIIFDGYDVPAFDLDVLGYCIDRATWDAAAINAADCACAMEREAQA